jgi:hypothetical protein
MYVILNDELYHHGIKGQRWGVRRFQNADGTRTAAGKRRRSEEEPDLKTTLDPKVLYDNRDKLSDKELNDKLNRLRKENELKKLSESNKKTKVPKIVIDGGKAILTAYIIKKGSKILDKADVHIMDKLKKATDNIFLPKF